MTKKVFETPQDKLLQEQQKTNRLLELISDQLELQFLQQFVNDASEPDTLRLHELSVTRKQVFDKRLELGLELG